MRDIMSNQSGELPQAAPVTVDPWRLLQRAGFHELIPDKDGRARADPEPSARLPIGKILLQAQYLTPAQVMRVLVAQASEPQTRFGELAVRMEFCGLREIEWAVLEQLATGDHPFELLAQREDTPAQEVKQLLLAYVHQLEARLRVITTENLQDVRAA